MNTTIINAVAVLLIIFICMRLCVVPKKYIWIVERNGEFDAAWREGWHFRALGQKIVKKFSLDELIVDSAPEKVTSKDGVTATVEFCVSFFVEDPKAFCYSSIDMGQEILKIGINSLHDIFRNHECDTLLNHKKNIIDKMMKDFRKEEMELGIRVNDVVIRSMVHSDQVE